MKPISTQKILLAFIKGTVIIVVVLCIVWLWFFAKTYLSYSSYQKEKILIKNAIFVGYVVDTPEKRTEGLSNKAFLPSNTSMLFEFDKPEIQGIWMKDMLFPIDIIWLDENKKIVNLVSNAEPESYPHVFYSPKKSLYILEVRSGLIKDKNLRLGDEILLDQEELK